MLEPTLSAIATDKISLPIFHEKKIEVHLLRLDKIHPVISGNKWFKLRFYLDDALTSNKTTIVTYGGAWSNHLVATAAASKLAGIKSVGIVRGERPATPSFTLIEAEKYGMRFIFMSRADYRVKKLPHELINEDSYIIPEGGRGLPGARGAATIFDYIDKHYSHFCAAVGTGTTLAGLINRTGSGQQVVGISVVDDKENLPAMVGTLVNEVPAQNYSINYDYTFGGYAKKDARLIEFMNQFYRNTGTPSDFVYTGKLFFAISDLAHKDYFPPESSILMIHSGGLQGNASLLKGTLIF